MREFDITYGDLNPEIMYAYKNKPQEEGTYHSHDWPEMTYILSGRCKYRIEGEEYILETGDLLIANPGVKHQYLILDAKESPVEFYIGFRGCHFRNMPQDSILLNDGGHILHCKAELRQELNRICYDMAAEYKGNKAGVYFMQRAYMTQMLLFIIRECMEKLNPMQSGYIFKSNNRNYVVKKIISYLNENYNEKISLDQIAHNMYLSPVYISKLFKEETGESPINYLIKIRLEKAKEILEKPESGSVKSIAKRVGYDDVYYFSKLFKKYYGMAPLHYRKGILEDKF